MTGAKRILAVLVVAIVILGTGLPCRAATQDGHHDGRGAVEPETAGPVMPARVVSVVDGDTLKVRLPGQMVTIRLHGVDAPERHQAYGRAATKALTALVGNRDVEIKPVEQDSYGRTVARVYVEGDDVNGRMVAQGYAWAFRRYLKQEPGALAYCDLEAEARAAGRGLWASPSRDWLPPWALRRRNQKDGGAGPDDGKDYSRETAADCRAAAGDPGIRKVSPGPGGCSIKGNINRRGQRIYHVPGSAGYEATRIDPDKGERWFCSEAAARAAGWRPPR